MKIKMNYSIQKLIFTFLTVLLFGGCGTEPDFALNESSVSDKDSMNAGLSSNSSEEPHNVDIVSSALSMAESSSHNLESASSDNSSEYAGESSAESTADFSSENSIEDSSESFVEISSQSIVFFGKIEAESFDDMAGVEIEENTTVGFIDGGDWLHYSNVEFSTGAQSISLNIASQNSGDEIEIRLDSKTGTLLGALSITSTGGWSEFEEQAAILSETSGTHDLFLVAKGGEGVANIDWLKLSGERVPEAPTDLIVATQSDASIQISWTDNASDESGFNIYWSAGTQQPSLPNVVVGSNESMYEISDLYSGTQYTVWVEAANSLFTSEPAMASTSTTGNPPPGFEVKIMSFNVRLDVDGGNRSWGARSWKSDAMIDSIRPDIIGLQEPFQHQVNDLAQFGGYESYGRGREADGSGESCHILYNPDKFTLDEDNSGTFWLSYNPNNPGDRHPSTGYARIATFAHLIENSTGKGLYIYNSHWDHQAYDQRAFAAQMIADSVNARAVATNTPFAILGDFNSDEWAQPVMDLISQVGGVDTFRELHPDEGINTYSGWNPYTNGNYKIDFIITGKEGHTTLAAEMERFQRDNETPSDHFPMTATIKFE